MFQILLTWLSAIKTRLTVVSSTNSICVSLAVAAVVDDSVDDNQPEIKTEKKTGKRKENHGENGYRCQVRDTIVLPPPSLPPSLLPPFSLLPSPPLLVAMQKRKTR